MCHNAVLQTAAKSFLMCPLTMCIIRFCPQRFSNKSVYVEKMWHFLSC